MTDTTNAPARRIVNPVQNGAVTWLATSEETGGERTLAELEVAPGGQVTPFTTAATRAASSCSRAA